LVHVDEDLADAAVLVLAGAQIHLVTADDRLLGITLAPLRKALATGPHFALDDAFDNALGNDRRARRRREVGEIVVGGVLAQGHGRQWLRQLGAVAIKRIGLEAELPRQFISLAAILDRGGVGHIDGFWNRPPYQRVRRSHHWGID